MAAAARPHPGDTQHSPGLHVETDSGAIYKQIIAFISIRLQSLSSRLFDRFYFYTNKKKICKYIFKILPW